MQIHLKPWNTTDNTFVLRITACYLTKSRHLTWRAVDEGTIWARIVLNVVVRVIILGERNHTLDNCMSTMFPVRRGTRRTGHHTWQTQSKAWHKWRPYMRQNIVDIQGWPYSFEILPCILTYYLLWFAIKNLTS